MNRSASGRPVASGSVNRGRCAKRARESARIAQTRAGRSAVPRAARQARRSERDRDEQEHDEHERSVARRRSRSRPQTGPGAGRSLGETHWHASRAARIRRSRPGGACRRLRRRPRSVCLPIMATASRTATITENADQRRDLEDSPPPGCAAKSSYAFRSGKKIRNATMMPASEPPAIRPVDIKVPGLMSASSSLNLRALSTTLRTMPPTKIGSVVESGR